MGRSDTFSPATTDFGRRLGLPPATAGDRRAEIALRRRLARAAQVGIAFATLAAAAGALFGDRPSVLGALVVGAVVAVMSLLVRALATQVLARLDAAVTERETLQAALDAAHEAEQKLREVAHHDDLTGLPDRSLLYDRLGVALTHSHRQATHLALLFLDLDDFKRVNDFFGHDLGDRLLVELATRMRKSVRAGDTVARFGGDEFVVLLDSVTGAEDASRVAAKVLEAMRVPFQLEGHKVSIVASVGVSVYPGDGTSAGELVRSADAAMYRDKQQRTAAGRTARDYPMTEVN